ncbi:Na+/H+ antiporter subunit E [Streptomyces sp. NPDC021020]|uniref:Na+/H+ antiporter subunit E n=1 Tax=Streptomyces sp. NPDC021020 TaxID=3365109 RepID=UPI00378BB688
MRSTNHALASVATVATWTALLLVLYVVLISAVTPLEWAVGGVLALLGGCAADAVRRAERPAVRADRRTAAALAALPAAMLRETAELARAVARALLRRGGGPAADRPVTVRLPAGGDPAVAAVLLSATPGACVVDIAPGRAPEMTVHLLGGPARAASPVERALGVRRRA